MFDSIADGVEEVGLSESGTAIDEEWIVGETGTIGDRLGGGGGELVGRTDHEAVKGECVVLRMGFQRERLGRGVGCGSISCGMAGSQGDVIVGAEVAAGDGDDVAEKVISDPVGDNLVVAGENQRLGGVGDDAKWFDPGRVVLIAEHLAKVGLEIEPARHGRRRG